MKELLVALMLIVGTVFVALAAFGVVRMPDLLMRMQATSKAVTLGLGCLMLAEALHFAALGTTLRFIAVIAFFALTAPVAAHAIARAGYYTGLPIWKGSVRDELGERLRQESSQGREGSAGS